MMTEQAVALCINDDTVNSWEWEIEFRALAKRRRERLENEKLSLGELYEEAEDATLEAYVYWAGLSEEAQRSCARDFKDMLVKYMALKERVREFARKELARRGVNGHAQEYAEEWHGRFAPEFPKKGIY